MNNKIIGINEQKMNLLINELSTAAETINKKFNEIEGQIDSTKEFFICEQGDRFRKKFSDEVSTNFSIIKKNILNISTDLINVKNGIKIQTDNAILDMKDKERNIIQYNPKKNMEV